MLWSKRNDEQVAAQREESVDEAATTVLI